MNNRVIIMREAVVRIVKMLADKEVKVTQRGARAFVEYHPISGRPMRVNIPYIPDDATDELLDAVQGFIDHEVAHILFSDYKALKAGIAKGVARLHNIIEDSYVERRMTAHFAGSGLNLRNVGAFFIKNYVENRLAEHPEDIVGTLFVPATRAWAGQSVFADYMEDKWHYMEEVVRALGPLTAEVPKCNSSDDCLALAIKFRDALERSREEEKEGKKGGKGSGKTRTESDPEGKGGKTAKKGDERSGSGGKGKPEAPTEEPTEADDDTPDDDTPTATSKGASDDTAPVEDSSEEDSSGDEPEADDTPTDDVPDFDVPPEDDDVPPEDDTADVCVAEEDDTPDDSTDGEDDTGEADDDIDMTEVDHGAAAPGEDDDEDDDGEGEEGEDDEPPGPSLLDELEEKLAAGKEYDDAVSEALSSKMVEETKSADYIVYTKELDIIEPMEVSARRGHWNDSLLKDMQDSVDHMVGPIQKDMERAIAARSLATWSAGHRSGRLHGASLARLTVFGDDRAFRRRHISDSKDVAAEILLDCSASMSGSKIKTTAFAGYGLAAVLDRMGIANELLGFTTHSHFPSEMNTEARRLGIEYSRHQTLYIPILKSFNERLTSENKKRFAALPYVHWLNENVDGESVQIAAARLAARREKRKILMVLSDGQPACPGDWRALQRHLKKSVQQVEASGIDVIGIGIESDAPKHFYSKYVLLNNVADLPSAVIGQIKQLLMK